MRDLKQVAESFFKLDPRIRYVAILNHHYDLLESRMREGVTSLTPVPTDRYFMTIAAPLMVDAASKLRPFCGSMKRITVQYDKLVLSFLRTPVHLVVLSLEPQVDQAVLDAIGNHVRTLAVADEGEEAEEPATG